MHRLGRLLAAAALLTGVFVAVSAAATATGAPAASAASGSGCIGFNTGGGSWAVECGNPGTTGNGGAPTVCSYYTLAAAVKAGLLSASQAAQLKAPKGMIYLVQYCTGGVTSTEILLFTDGGQPTGTLANQLYGELSPPILVVNTAPPSAQEGLVGLPEWFWIPASDYQTLKKTITLGDLSATVTASPGPLIITPGNGQAPFSCVGPGTQYNTADPATSQHSNCTYVYNQPSSGQRDGEFTVTISVTWNASWTGSNGTGGQLLPIVRTITMALKIAQGETVISG
jgi:hypothetical protein